jgi:DNA polymerase III epsilon subunit-like protein
MYVFFDTETSDLPRRWNAPVTDVQNWPRLVQICWVTCSAEGESAPPQTHLIKPEGFEIAPGAAEVHGISTDHALENGEPLRPVLDEFVRAVEGADQIVAHNISFDACVVGAELIRARIPNLLERKTQRCTMKESADFCQLPGRYGFKWPSLSELHQILFSKPLRGAHDAQADCLACLHCFLELKKRHAIQ